MYKLLVNTEVHTGSQQNIMVVLGWYPLKKFKRIIPNELYGVAGSLFNGQYGSELLLSNLFYNPQITDIVLCFITEADKSIRYPCKQLFKMIVSKQHEPDFKDLLENVNFHFVKEENQLKPRLEELKILSGSRIKENRRKQIIKPVEMNLTKNIDSQFNNQSIVKKKITNAHFEILKRLVNGGRDTNDYKHIRELLNLSVTITELPVTAETLEDICNENEKVYIKQFIDGVNDQFNYGYGDRLLNANGINQIDEAIDKLKRKPDSLAVLMCVWIVKDLLYSDSPCLTQIWLRQIDRVLYLTATFRSNDMFKAWKANVLGLRNLQILIANRIGAIVGDLTTISMSAHIYHLDFDNIREFLTLKGDTSDKFKTFNSCVGNFVINVLDSCLMVGHFNNEGRPIKTYSFTVDESESNIKATHKILKEIIDKNPTIETEHLLYLFSEISKAEIAIINGLIYHQS